MQARCFTELSALVAVVEAGGFSAAARASGVRKATLSERVRALETRLGTSLLVRTTRSLRLTADGEMYMEQARQAVEHARQAEQVVATTASVPSGMLRVSLHPSLAAEIVPALVPSLLARSPRLRIEVDTSTRRVDLLREPFDLAIRLGDVAPSDLISKRLGVCSGGYFASRAYLKRAAKLERPADLAQHALIVITLAASAPEWPFARNSRLTWQKVEPRLAIDNFELAIAAAEAGAGIVRAPANLVAPALARRTLEPVLEEYWPPAMPAQALLTPGALRTPKVRVFLDAVVALLSPAKAGPARGGAG